MNSKYLFFQNSFSISYFKLEERFDEMSLQYLNFLACDHISMHGDCRIKQLLVGSNPELVVIVLEISADFVQIFTWDMNTNTEAGFNDKIEKNFHIIWDDRGYPYILTKDKVYFTN